MRRYQGATDIPLNETGIEQARRVAAGLSGVKFARVVSSPRSRAVTTASIISGLPPEEIEIADSLREGSLGEWEARLESDIVAEIGGEYEKWRGHAGLLAPPGGESLFHVMARLYPVVEEWREYSKGNDMLAVGHQGGNAAVLMLVLGVCSREAAAKYRQRNGQVDVIDARKRLIVETKFFD